jgi:hypothetical protein
MNNRKGFNCRYFPRSTSEWPLRTAGEVIVFTFASFLEVLSSALHVRRKISPSAAEAPGVMQSDLDHVFLIDHNTVGFAKLFLKTSKTRVVSLMVVRKMYSFIIPDWATPGRIIG